MRKNNKKNLTLAILTACMLILGACGKSEEEKAADEIYAHLDAEEQANVDKDREEIANYEAAKKTEAETYEAAKEVNYIDVLTEWELGKDMLPCTEQSFTRGQDVDIDFGNSLSILYPDKEYVECVHDGCYDVGRQSSGLFVFRAFYYVAEGEKGIMNGKEEEIGNYKLSTSLDDYQSLSMAIYDKDSDKSIIIQIIGAGGGMYNEELVSKNYDFIVEQVKSWEQNETTDEETTDEESVQGEIPYGSYICSENGKYADVDIEDGVADVIMFEDANTASGVEGMYDIVWVEGSTYSIELGDRFGTATIDTNGNMQVTADKDELKPYEGYYTKTE